MQNVLADIFAECMKPKEETEKTAKEYVFSDSQTQAVSDFKASMVHITGVTIEGVRYVTNNHILISSFAIATTDAWHVFKEIFATLGDNWHSAQYHHNAIKLPDPNVPASEAILNAIKGWRDDFGDLEYLASSEGLAFMQNQDGQLVTVNDEYATFAGSLGFALDNIEDPFSPITMTHCQSLGFGGLLMPMRPDNTTPFKDAADKLRKALALVEDIVK